LPALRAVDDARPVLVVDSREQTPLRFLRLRSEVGGLTTGDYSFRGGEEVFAVERKSIADLVSCCMNSNRERFERELHRLRGFWFSRLLVVGSRADVMSHSYRSELPPKAVMATVAAFEVRYGVAVVWIGEESEAAAQVEDWAWWAARELVLAANRVAKGLA
jgi:ERCC4-type nuclease